jgi:hypothetical protein
VALHNHHDTHGAGAREWMPKIDEEATIYLEMEMISVERTKG